MDIYIQVACSVDTVATYTILTLQVCAYIHVHMHVLGMLSRVMYMWADLLLNTAPSIDTMHIGQYSS
jgi:hypothetical protein